MIKCEASRAFYRFFCNEGKINETRVRMLDSIYSMTFKLFLIAFLGCVKPPNV